MIESTEIVFVPMHRYSASVFSADIRRKHSPEVDYGVWWRDGQAYPTYRVSFIVDTGELYAIDVNEKSVEILAIFTEFGLEKYDDEARKKFVESVMAGWAEKCGDIDSLEWVRECVKQ